MHVRAGASGPRGERRALPIDARLPVRVRRRVGCAAPPKVVLVPSKPTRVADRALDVDEDEARPAARHDDGAPPLEDPGPILARREEPQALAHADEAPP